MPFFGTPRASTSPGEEGVPLSPYMGTGATPTNRGASLTGRYCEYCAGVGVRPDPSVLVFLRLSLSELAVRPHQTAKRSERSRFGDTDLFALCDFLLHTVLPKLRSRHLVGDPVRVERLRRFKRSFKKNP